MAPNNANPRANQLRILFIAGGLGTGGAEKQLIYMLRALRSLGVEILVITLTEGELHEKSLADLGIQPVSVARLSPPTRLAYILRTARAFRPHFIQATHFFASFYAGAAGRLSGITSIGAVRGDFHHDLAGVGRSGRWLIRLPSVLLANSYNARQNAIQMGLPGERVQVLHNVIDLDEFDRKQAQASQPKPASGPCQAVTVARLIQVKRLERFLKSLAEARRRIPNLQGVIIGGGPEEVFLRQTALELGLQPDSPEGGVLFMGERGDVPQLLARSDIYVMTSDREGFPNVLLEAMAASLPILSTPAGETPELVEDGANGYLVGFEDQAALTRRLVELAGSAELRRGMGSEGRRKVERQYGYPHLKTNLLQVYQTIARQVNDRSTLDLLENHLPAVFASD